MWGVWGVGCGGWVEEMRVGEGGVMVCGLGWWGGGGGWR